MDKWCRCSGRVVLQDIQDTRDI